MTRNIDLRFLNSILFQKEQCEHSKRKISQLTRQLYNAKGECSNLTSQLEEFAEIRQTLMEQENTIAALRKSCSVRILKKILIKMLVFLMVDV